MDNQQEAAYAIKPLTPLRKVIASRMTAAKQQIPHYRVSMDIRMDALMALRHQLNSAGPAQKLSINDFILKAAGLALMQYPALNSQWIDGEIHQYARADIAVVVAVTGGLATPVIRDVAHLSVEQIAVAVADAAAKASAGQLKRRDIEGGTFSVSNLGRYGVDQFDAIINPPQVAILAVGSVKQQMVVEDNNAVAAHVMRLSLSLDHRVIDGVEGAEFLGVVKRYLETPTQWLVQPGEGNAHA